MGLEDTSAGVWTLFAAIASHKFVISFCMGVELVSVSGEWMIQFMMTAETRVKQALKVQGAAATHGRIESRLKSNNFLNEICLQKDIAVNGYTG